MRANRYELMIGAGLIFFSVAMSALALEEREWKARKGPDRHEGIQMQLKGAQLELLSAAVLYKQEPRQGEEPPSSGKAHLQFYLADDVYDEPVFVTVRDFRYHNYWMKPARQEWDKGWCPFSWPRTEVLGKLEPEPALYELGALARIGGEYSNKLAPIVVYQEGGLPPEIAGYRFVFRSSDRGDVVELEWTWYWLGGETPQQVGDQNSSSKRQRAGKPFYIDWKCVRDGEPLREGWYQLSLSGKIEYFSRPREKFEKVYQLYHQPNMEVE